MSSLYSDKELLDTISITLKKKNISSIDDPHRLGRKSWWRAIAKSILLKLVKNIGSENRGLIIPIIEKGISDWARSLLSGKLTAASHRCVSWIASDESTNDIIEDIEDEYDDVIKTINDLKKMKNSSGFFCCSNSEQSVKPVKVVRPVKYDKKVVSPDTK